MVRHSHPEGSVDGIIHAVGLCASVAAVAVLMIAAVQSLPVPATASLAIYSAGLLAMLGCSAAYNLIPIQNWKHTLQRFDHAAIFVKIAATYTPFALIKMGGVAGYTLLSVVWSIALFGAVGKLLLNLNWKGIDIVLYLALGWAGIAAFQPLAASLDSSVLILLLVGGGLYSLGVIF